MVEHWSGVERWGGVEHGGGLEHGGGIRQAALDYKIPLDQWLDLSTGINPNGWQVPATPASIWQRLPENSDGLETAASAYYGCHSLLPVAGSQAAIQALPKLRPASRVGILSPSYSEHCHAWQSADHEVIELGLTEIEAAIDRLDVLLICRPNNPDGLLADKALLLEWHKKLAEKGGWLIVDEAFIDVTPEESLASQSGQKGLVILRSLGKFFGLAGARVGFVLAEQSLLLQLNKYLGPWSISGPGRWVATQALRDSPWQADTRIDLKRSGERLVTLLTQYGLKPSGGTSLFQQVESERAAQIYDACAHQGILIRLFKEQSAIRFGLPGSEGEWQRFQETLAVINPS